MTNHTLAHTTWNCKYNIVFAPKYRRKAFYNQLKEDAESSQLIMDLNSFTCGKN